MDCSLICRFARFFSRRRSTRSSLDDDKEEEENGRWLSCKQTKECGERDVGTDDDDDDGNRRNDGRWEKAVTTTAVGLRNRSIPAPLLTSHSQTQEEAVTRIRRHILVPEGSSGPQLLETMQSLRVDCIPCYLCHHFVSVSSEIRTLRVLERPSTWHSVRPELGI